jgi:membrane-bound lytic murein transglycosylase A
MKTNITFLTVLLLVLGCSKQPQVLVKELPNTDMCRVDFGKLPQFEKNDFQKVLDNFIYDCSSAQTEKIYGHLCQEAKKSQDAKKFILENFQAYRIYTEDFQDTGLLTGYYEPELEASLSQSKQYPYPLYATPKDLIEVDLSSIYPELKDYRLRGRIEGQRLLPYFTRKEIKNSDKNIPVLCYCRSKIDKFFLEVQGSGKVILDDNSTFYVGYANQNGHRYSSIGKYLVKSGAIAKEDISLESIRAWLEQHPHKIDEILDKNKAMVFFTKRSKGATGALGLQLRAKSSVAVDKRYIPLGSMLYLSAKIEDKEQNKFVFAQDVGGAIKGALRADYFAGSGTKALAVAGNLQTPLRLWILLPIEKEKK